MKIFVTGIGTDVGKTIVSAILVEALKADYWKPIQAGDLEYGDKHKVESYISNTKTKFHPSAYELQTPMSPHAAAEIDGISIELEKIKTVETRNILVIEGAGGLLVPLNNSQVIADIIDQDAHLVLVASNYLGSINHTLLSCQYLKQLSVASKGIVFNGESVNTSENIILQLGELPLITRVPKLNTADLKQEIKRISEILRPTILQYFKVE